MTLPSSRAGALPGWLPGVFFAVWTVLAAVAVWWFALREPESRVIFVEMGAGGTLDASASRLVMQQQLLPWVPWLLLAPYVLGLAARFPLFGRRKWVHVLVLVPAALAFIGVCLVFQDQAARRQPILAPMPAVESWFPPGFDKTPGGEFGIPLTREIGRDPQQELPEAFGLPPEVDPRKLPGVIFTREELKQRIEAQWADIARRADESLGGLKKVPAMSKVLLDGFVYAALLILSHAWLFLRTARRENERAAELHTRHAQARAQALQAQLQPHFLFNTLNGIAMLTRKDPERAEEMIMSLSELLRIALDGERQAEIPLREELHFVDRYLDIQRMRFGNRLKVEREVARDTLGLLVPALLVQPLVENAIHHGIEPRGSGGCVRVVTALDGDMLTIRIEDDGVGIGHSKGGSGSGIGMASIRERLAALYPGRHVFRSEEPPGGGVHMIIQLPAHTATR
ncbi:histidine kinase [Luteolibacter flavescens]|uniref:histidine kinase n=1 Tax=Luteolibacter flavescens TaxID=1859460 RepID=A0ABT3FMV3_9BACT|nr:histidine kinase [Luteolibacter flavescens]MCW1884669.1 histidine kinase [Luteolibacter flavescens]